MRRSFNKSLFYSSKRSFFKILSFFGLSGRCKHIEGVKYISKDRMPFVLKETFVNLILKDEFIAMVNTFLPEREPNVFILMKEFGDILDVYYVYNFLERDVFFDNKKISFYIVYYTNVFHSSGNFNEETYTQCILYHIYYDQADVKLDSALRKLFLQNADNISLNGFPSYLDYLKSLDTIIKYIK